MRQTHLNPRPDWKRRGLALLLAFVLTLGLVPGFDLGGTGAAHWADAYLSQLVEWGFIRPDQSGSPEKELTRADFMAITNRAYGYHENGPTPFEDIKQTDWFYDDVGIAYTAKFIKGTSPTTASPDDTLTRETAATILGRNMMLQESAGEILDFTDARDISFWSKGVIKSSLEHYLIGGYDDGTFRPQRPVTWGEMAAMVTRIVGTPLQEAGDYSLGGVFGNVTISSPGVTLRDTVISGDLYVTGGVGLGDIKLENVTVLGRIICSGTGEAEGGQASILLRNVTADEMLIDNLQGKTVSIQADGITEIGKTTVRTSAYIEDNTPEGMGLHYVSLEGVVPDEDDPDFEDYEPPVLTLAGHVEEVVNKTPESLIHVAKGSVSKLTIDEAATDSQVTIDRNSEVKELNLDTATKVDGEGDIKHLNVNAPGCEVTILPEQITIRPGITAEINGEEMDTTAAEESNQTPQILSGYPKAEDIAPTTMSAVFAANKKGTVYWAVSAVTDGSVGLDDLLKPPVYGSIAVANGSVKITKAEEEVRAAVSKLTPGGTYYLSAVMVDERGLQSPVKVISFATPDNTVPAFCEGYPHMSSTSAQKGCQVVVMPTKSCNMYYALLPKGAKAPTEAEFKANSVSGALGFGVVPVTKNTESVIRVDDVTLEEQKEYVLYLWLVDADGMNKSKVTSLTFVTDDETLPFFIVQPTVNKVQANSVSLNFRLSEAGTVYWAVVPVGTEYPKKQPGHDSINLSDDWAKLQVQNGYSAFKSGKVAATPDKDGTITVSGLDPETAYELYYVAVDKAGNYSAMVQHMTINTLDQTGPTISQIFTKYSGLDNTMNPMVDTDIILRVSENVRSTVDGAGEDLLSLYQASVDRTSSEIARKEARDKLVLSLRSSLVLNRVASGTGSKPVAVKGDTGVGDNWVIDYEKVTVALKDKTLEITFPADGLQLDSGNTYYFTADKLTDVSDAQNPVVPSPVDFYTNAGTGQAAGHDLRVFTIMLGQLFLTDDVSFDNLTQGPVKPGSSEMDPAKAKEEDRIPVDFLFDMIPRSTSKMDDSMCWDLLFYTDAVIDFDLYYRVVKDNPDGSRTPVDLSKDENSKYRTPNWDKAQNAGTAGWYKLGSSEILRGAANALAGATLGTQFNNCNQSNFPKLNKLDDSGSVFYEFAASVTQKDISRIRSEWSGDVSLYVYGAASASRNLSTLTAHPTFKAWDDGTDSSPATASSFLGRGLTNGGGVSIGIDQSNKTYLRMHWPFTDNRIPSFETDGGYPKFEPQDNYVIMKVALDRSGTIDYVIAPREGGIDPTVINNNPSAAGTPAPPVAQKFSQDNLWLNTPRSGLEMQPGVDTTKPGASPKDAPEVVLPEALSIAQKNFPRHVQGSAEYITPGDTMDIKAEGLMPDTDYYVYFVTSGVSTKLSPVYIYKFHSRKTAKPKINLTPDELGNGNVHMISDRSSQGHYRVLSDHDARNNILFLKAPFKEYSDYYGTNQLPDIYAADDFTVLDALTKTYSNYEAKQSSKNAATAYFPGEDDGNVTDFEGGYSVFDIYANTAGRTKMRGLVYEGQPGLGENIETSTVNWAAEGDTSMKENWADNLLTIGNKLFSTTQYVILAAARDTGLSKSDALVHSFSALSFRKMSLAPPNVIKVTPISNLAVGTVPGTYSGTYLVSFDSNVYIMKNEQPTPIRQVTGPDILSERVSTPGNGTNGTITVSNLLDRSFELKFTNVRPSGTILFDAERFLSVNGSPATEQLKITLDTGTDEVRVSAVWGPDEEGKDLQDWGVIDRLSTAGAKDMSMILSSRTPGAGLGGGVGETAEYTLDLGVGYQPSVEIEAFPSPQPTGDFLAHWVVEGGTANVVSVSGSDKLKRTITATGTGTTRVTVTVANVVNGQTQSVSRTIAVTVHGEMELKKEGGGGTLNGPASGGKNYTVDLTYNSADSSKRSIELGTLIDPANTALNVNWTATNNKGIFEVKPDGFNKHTATITALASAKDGDTGTITLTGPGLEQVTITVRIKVETPISNLFGATGQTGIGKNPYRR